MHRIQFERLLVLFNSYLSQIPLTFLLGFYVTMVFNRFVIAQLLSRYFHFRVQMVVAISTTALA